MPKNHKYWHILFLNNRIKDYTKSGGFVTSQIAFS